jgi:hypothetical protein
LEATPVGFEYETPIDCLRTLHPNGLKRSDEFRDPGGIDQLNFFQVGAQHAAS